MVNKKTKTAEIIETKPPEKEGFVRVLAFSPWEAALIKICFGHYQLVLDEQTRQVTVVGFVPKKNLEAYNKARAQVREEIKKRTTGKTLIFAVDSVEEIAEDNGKKIVVLVGAEIPAEVKEFQTAQKGLSSPVGPVKG